MFGSWDLMMVYKMPRELSLPPSFPGAEKREKSSTPFYGENKSCDFLLTYLQVEDVTSFW